jgi:hypothetical protein
MALFTDGISTIQDLMGQDNSVLTTAQTENIDLSQKLAMALTRAGDRSDDAVAAGNTCGWQFWLPPEPAIEQHRGHAAAAALARVPDLTLVYQDAYYNQLNDRYKGKRDQFQQLAKWAMEKLIQTGLGIARTRSRRPLRRN